MEEFAKRLSEGLEGSDWLTRREIIRALVKRVEVDEQEVRIVYRVSPSPFEDRPQQGFLQHCWGRKDVGFGKTTAEVTRSGRVGQPFGPQRIEVDLVLAAQFEVLQAFPSCQEVGGNVQNVVALVVGQVPFEQVEIPVDVTDQADLASQGVAGAEASCGDGADAVGDLVMDVGGGHHGLNPLDTGSGSETPLEGPLAFAELTGETELHSKTSWLRRMGVIASG